MAIQFTCSNCGQPIEVDAEHAGQSAACPYCRFVVTVPSESTFNPQAAIVARPGRTDDAPPASTEMMSPSLPPTAGYGGVAPVRPVRPATIGKYALICAMIAVVLFGGAVVRGFSLLASSGLLSATSAPTGQEFSYQQMQMSRDTWASGLSVGAIFFALGGLILSIVSMVYERPVNWKAVVSVVICGLFMFCMCAGALVSMSGLGGLPTH